MISSQVPCSNDTNEKPILCKFSKTFLWVTIWYLQILHKMNAWRTTMMSSFMVVNKIIRNPNPNPNPFSSHAFWDTNCAAETPTNSPDTCILSISSLIFICCRSTCFSLSCVCWLGVSVLRVWICYMWRCNPCGWCWRYDMQSILSGGLAFVLWARNDSWRNLRALVLDLMIDWTCSFWSGRPPHLLGRASWRLGLKHRGYGLRCFVVWPEQRKPLRDLVNPDLRTSKGLQ